MRPKKENAAALTKQRIIAAMQLGGFENWRPNVDVPELERPMSRPSELDGPGRIAAVMIMAFIRDESTQIVLTKRHADLSKHASQISLPGGQQDPNESLAETAIRETEEEIGVPSREIELLGQLNTVYIPPSDFTVTPFVGWHEGAPKFVRSESEVDQIIETSIETLMNPETLVFGEIMRSSGKTQRVPFYQVDGHQVWGATAIILGEFVERLRRMLK